MNAIVHATHPSVKTGFSRVAQTFTKWMCDAEYNVWHLGYDSATSSTEEVAFGDPRATTIDIGSPDDQFGFHKFDEYVNIMLPDIIVIINDPIVCCQSINRITNKSRRFKIVCCVALEYEYPNVEIMEHINKYSDAIFLPAERWRRHLSNEMKVFSLDKTYTLPYPYMMKSAPIINILPNPSKQFIILNTNRNVFRKLNDITIAAFLKFWKGLGCLPHVKLVLNCCPMTKSGYNIDDVIKRECQILNLNFLLIMEDKIITNYGGGIKEEELKHLYETSHVGLNTCGGEGFGLTQLEGSIHGMPQIVTDTGGLSDMFTSNERNKFPNCFTLIEPSVSVQIPHAAENIGGMFNFPKSDYFANALSNLYKEYPSKSTREEFSKLSIRKYNEDDIYKLFINTIKTLPPRVPELGTIIYLPVSNNNSTVNNLKYIIGSYTLGLEYTVVFDENKYDVEMVKQHLALSQKMLENISVLNRASMRKLIRTYADGTLSVKIIDTINTIFQILSDVTKNE